MSDTGEKLRALAMVVFVVMAATLALAAATVPVAAANEPTISNVALSATANEELKFNFESDEQLGSSAGDIAVSVDGPNTANVYTFDRNDFSESPLMGGGYLYALSATQKYDDGDGTYAASVDDAKDSDGNNGGNNGAGSGLSDTYSYTSDSVDSQSFSIKSGSGDASKITLNAQYTQAGFLSLQFKNSSNGYDLATAGVDGTTVIDLSVTVDAGKPKVLIGNGLNASWSRTDNGDGTWTVDVTAEPTEANFKFPPPASFDGSHQANVGADKALVLAASDLSFMSSERRTRLDGMLFMTDAQNFGPPRYNDTGSRDAIEFDLSAPHLAVDGTVNEGFAEVLLTDAMLDHWGVSASDITGRWKGSDRTTTIKDVANGAFAKISISYSADTAQYTVSSGSGGSPTFNIPADATPQSQSSTPTPTPAPTPTPTPAPTPTPSPTATPTAATPTPAPATTASATATPAATATPGADGPGFGPIVTLLALVGTLLLALRRS